MSITISATQQAARMIIPIALSGKKHTDDAIADVDKTDNNSISTAVDDKSSIEDSKSKDNSIKLDKTANSNNATSGNSGGVSLTAVMLQRRIKELEKQLQDQQQELQKISVANYSSDTEKMNAVMAAESQILGTSAALSQASSQLSAELSNNPIHMTA